MLYTQQFVMPESGSYRIGTIGGDVYEWVKESQASGEEIPGLQQKQVGYMIPPRFGLLRVSGLAQNDPNLFQCLVSVQGYNENPKGPARVPGDIVTEFPCSVVITGPADTNLIVEAWPLVGVGTRGASFSVVGDQVGIAIPNWATVVDFAGSTAIFRDVGGGVVGALNTPAPVVNFSIPNNAVTVDITGAVPENTTLIFRQQG